ncbi:hypothetical protein BDW02DRAFT_414959 [Decorospora gaudefroyi]|uniref:Uncharacterized protein n=1 Tax=Decorospora gaudefroyi TaxID=184978 RepID=A0A6A5KQW0_9PLEO|nr:hypothetical protein BDW02DRAFT_414959 [Decorospora gaudefroyi]
MRPADINMFGLKPVSHQLCDIGSHGATVSQPCACALWQSTTRDGKWRTPNNFGISNFLGAKTEMNINTDAYDTNPGSSHFQISPKCELFIDDDVSKREQIASKCSASKLGQVLILQFPQARSKLSCGGKLLGTFIISPRYPCSADTLQTSLYSRLRSAPISTSDSQRTCHHAESFAAQTHTNWVPHTVLRLIAALRTHLWRWRRIFGAEYPKTHPAAIVGENTMPPTSATGTTRPCDEKQFQQHRWRSRKTLNVGSTRVYQQNQIVS